MPNIAAASSSITVLSTEATRNGKISEEAMPATGPNGETTVRSNVPETSCWRIPAEAAVKVEARVRMIRMPTMTKAK